MGAQIMGGNPDLLSRTATALVRRGAPRIDLNCGCPANTVTGKGAGSSLLLDPDRVYACLSAMVEAVEAVEGEKKEEEEEQQQQKKNKNKRPVTVKMRSGFHDGTSMMIMIMMVKSGG